MSKNRVAGKSWDAGGVTHEEAKGDRVRRRPLEGKGRLEGVSGTGRSDSIWVFKRMPLWFRPHRPFVLRV